MLIISNVYLKMDTDIGQLISHIDSIENVLSGTSGKLVRQINIEWQRLLKSKNILDVKQEELLTAKERVMFSVELKTQNENFLAMAQKRLENLKMSNAQQKKKLNKLHQEKEKVFKSCKSQEEFMREKIAFYEDKLRKRYESHYLNDPKILEKHRKIKEYDDLKEKLRLLDEEQRKCEKELFQAKSERNKSVEESKIYPFENFVIYIAKVYLETRKVYSECVRVFEEIKVGESAKTHCELKHQKSNVNVSFPLPKSTEDTNINAGGDTHVLMSDLQENYVEQMDTETNENSGDIKNNLMSIDQNKIKELDNSEQNRCRSDESFNSNIMSNRTLVMNEENTRCKDTHEKKFTNKTENVPKETKVRKWLERLKIFVPKFTKISEETENSRFQRDEKTEKSVFSKGTEKDESNKRESYSRMCNNTTYYDYKTEQIEVMNKEVMSNVTNKKQIVESSAVRSNFIQPLRESVSSISKENDNMRQAFQSESNILNTFIQPTKESLSDKSKENVNIRPTFQLESNRSVSKYFKKSDEGMSMETESAYKKDEVTKSPYQNDKRQCFSENVMLIDKPKTTINDRCKENTNTSDVRMDFIEDSAEKDGLSSSIQEAADDATDTTAKKITECSFNYSEYKEVIKKTPFKSISPFTVSSNKETDPKELHILTTNKTMFAGREQKEFQLNEKELPCSTTSIMNTVKVSNIPQQDHGDSDSHMHIDKPNNLSEKYTERNFSHEKNIKDENLEGEQINGHQRDTLAYRSSPNSAPAATAVCTTLDSQKIYDSKMSDTSSKRPLTSDSNPQTPSTSQFQSNVRHRDPLIYRASPNSAPAATAVCTTLDSQKIYDSEISNTSSKRPLTSDSNLQTPSTSQFPIDVQHRDTFIYRSSPNSTAATAAVYTTLDSQKTCESKVSNISSKQPLPSDSDPPTPPSRQLQNNADANANEKMDISNFPFYKIPSQSDGFVYASRSMFQSNTAANDGNAIQNIPKDAQNKLLAQIQLLNSSPQNSNASAEDKDQFLASVYEDYLTDSPPMTKPEKNMFAFAVESPENDSKTDLFPLFASSEGASNKDSKNDVPFTFNFGNNSEPQSPEESRGFKFLF